MTESSVELIVQEYVDRPLLIDGRYCGIIVKVMFQLPLARFSTGNILLQSAETLYIVITLCRKLT